jgi:hypothetical protein
MRFPLVSVEGLCLKARQSLCRALSPGRRRAGVALEPMPDLESVVNAAPVDHSRKSWARALSTGECRDWLVRNREGRLSYESGRGSRSVVVPYAITGDQVMLRFPDFNEIVQYAPGERVRLDVDGPAARPGDYDAVSVTATAQLAGRRDARAMRLTQFEESWPAGVTTSVICVPLLNVLGVKQRHFR